jgi:hypothetical protein
VLGAAGGEAAQLLHARGQRVARALELPQVEQAPAGRRLRGPVRGGDVRERVGDDRRELALQPCDLPAQRRARTALGGPAPLGQRAVLMGLLVARRGGDRRPARGSPRIDHLLLSLGHFQAPLGRAESGTLPAPPAP